MSAAPRIPKRTKGKIDRRGFRKALCPKCGDRGFVPKTQASHNARVKNEAGFVLCPKKCPASKTPEALHYANGCPP